MGKRLDGQVAVITGSTSGIGRACAELFATEGARVVVNGRRRELGRQIVRDIVDRRGTASYCFGDMSKSEDVKALIEHALDAYGRVDVLMNNAFSGYSASVTDLSEADWDAMYAIMLKAPILACKHAIPQMVERGSGSIINTASVHGVLAARSNAPYSTFKAALINLTRQMAVDYGPYNIRVNALCPGRILTEAKYEFLAAHPDEVRRQKHTYPLGRPGTVSECAHAALFLACNESSFVTGHALMVDGGLTAQLQDSAAKHNEEQVLAELGVNQG